MTVPQPVADFPDTTFLLGAKIISVNMEMDVVDSIVVSTTDGKQYIISGASYTEGFPELEIDKVQHPIKVISPIRSQA